MRWLAALSFGVWIAGTSGSVCAEDKPNSIRILLTTDHPKNSPGIAWTKSYGNSRVFYLMLGHDSKAWANPNYPKLLAQGIRWAAGK